MTWSIKEYRLKRLAKKVVKLASKVECYEVAVTSFEKVPYHWMDRWANIKAKLALLNYKIKELENG